MSNFKNIYNDSDENLRSKREKQYLEFSKLIGCLLTNDNNCTMRSLKSIPNLMITHSEMENIKPAIELLLEIRNDTRKILNIASAKKLKAFFSDEEQYGKKYHFMKEEDRLDMIADCDRSDEAMEIFLWDEELSSNKKDYYFTVRDMILEKHETLDIYVCNLIYTGILEGLYCKNIKNIKKVSIYHNTDNILLSYENEEIKSTKFRKNKIPILSHYDNSITKECDVLLFGNHGLPLFTLGVGDTYSIIIEFHDKPTGKDELCLVNLDVTHELCNQIISGYINYTIEFGNSIIRIGKCETTVVSYTSH